MSKFQVHVRLNDNIIENMSVKCFEKESIKVAKFIEERGERFHYDNEKKQYYINSFYPSFPSEAWDRFIIGASNIVKNNIRIPLQADIVVTGRCHCRCWHCFRIKDKREDLTLNEIARCMNDLYELGTATVGITGGEPMLREDIKDIIEMIPEGMQGQLYTTGHNINEEFAKFIKHSRVSRVIISIDHFDKEVACKMRNYNKAFEEAIEAVRILTKVGVYTAITVCITDNLLENTMIDKYFEFASELGPNEIRVVMPIPQGNLEGKDVSILYSEAVKYVKSKKRKYCDNIEYPGITNFCEFESANYLGCSAGANYISINNDGLVTPCVAVPLSFGNIREKNLKQIFEGMGKYFPCSSRICYGKTSGKIICRKKVDTSVTPISVEKSSEVAELCPKSSRRAAIFECFR